MPPLETCRQTVWNSIATFANLSNARIGTSANSPRANPNPAATVATVGVGLFVTGASVLALPVLLPIIGFGAAGPIAGRCLSCARFQCTNLRLLKTGSLAALIQSTFYGGAVGAGSAFAIAQSIGMTGLGVGTVAASTGAVIGGAALLNTDVGGSGEPDDEKDEKDDGDDGDEAAAGQAGVVACKSCGASTSPI